MRIKVFLMRKCDLLCFWRENANNGVFDAKMRIKVFLMRNCDLQCIWYEKAIYTVFDAKMRIKSFLMRKCHFQCFWCKNALYSVFRSWIFSSQKLFYCKIFSKLKKLSKSKFLKPKRSSHHVTNSKSTNNTSTKHK